MLGGPRITGALAALALAAAAFGGSGSVQFDAAPMSLRYRVTLGGHSGEYSIAEPWPGQGQAELEVALEVDQTGNPTGVEILELAGGLAAPHVFGVSIAPFGSVYVTFSNVQFALSGPGPTVPIDEAGSLAASGLAAACSGQLSFETYGTQCGQLLAGGSTCVFNGPISAAAVQATVSGSIHRQPFEPGWTFELRVAMLAPIMPELPGNHTVEIWATLRGTVTEFSAVCPEDWDGDTLVTVQDIFAFLTAWFAGEPDALSFGGTPGVPAIFAFLSAWFARPVGSC